MSSQQPIYLDYAAATPMDSAAIAAMEPYLANNFYNPSAVYQSAREVRKQLEAARGQVASVLGAKDQEVIFTAGGTEANNLAISGIIQQFPEANIVVSSIEHESVLEPADRYQRRIVGVNATGLIDLKQLEESIDDQTVLVSIMYANNEVGTVQPIKDIAALIAKKRLARTTKLPLYLHTDACQAANYLDLQVTRLGVDLLTLNGGKIYAAKQSGCLYVRTGVKLQGQTLGGGQERALRSGTENVANCIAFATMLQKIQGDRKIETDRIGVLKNKLFATLSQNFPNLILNGHTKKRLPNNLNITLPGADGERLLMELDNAGVLVATGSACTASSDDPSHVLLALGISEADASASIRITLGRFTSEAEIESAAKTITNVMRAHSRLV
jgi:cysteine desulfurase